MVRPAQEAGQGTAAVPAEPSQETLNFTSAVEGIQPKPPHGAELTDRPVWHRGCTAADP